MTDVSNGYGYCILLIKTQSLKARSSLIERLVQDFGIKFHFANYLRRKNIYSRLTIIDYLGHILNGTPFIWCYPPIYIGQNVQNKIKKYH